MRMFAVLLFAATSAFAQNADFDLIKVADGVYAAVAKPGGIASGNAGFVIGDDGVVVVDTFFTPAAAEELVAEIAKLTPKPIRFAVNTHYHLDHTGGNQVFVARGVPIVAHDNVMLWQTVKNRRFLPSAEELQKRREDAAAKKNEAAVRRVDAMKAIVLTNPTVTFSTGTLHLHVGKREVQLFSLPGHTGGDVLAFVPDANVLFTGDLGWTRTLPNLVDATVNDWIPTLDKILAMYPNAKFVTGHGQPATAVELREFRGYLDDLRSRVKKAVADGLTLDQAKAQLALPEQYKRFAFQNFEKANVEDMYKEVAGTKQQ
ncbi:MAG TPA: MBL fold metallo-hydrolase [Thermoanaerobaculia bacterium]|nr:MBL fold metallo-hydrolase [Thermoanaerobaculia bacterium]